MGEFSQWYYADVPRLILRAGRGYLRQTYLTLSMPVLVHTLFAPWRRDEQSGRNLALGAQIRLWFENLMSRLIGLCIRIFTLVIGSFLLGFEVSLFFVGYLVWLTLPFLIVVLFGLGVRLVFVGGH